MNPKGIAELDVWKANMAIAVGLLAIHLFTEAHNPVWLYAAFGVGVCILLVPFISRWIAWGWFKLAAGLGYINSRVLLSIVFFVFLLPVSLVYRLFRRNALDLKDGPKLPTLFKERNHQYKPEDLENVW